MNSKRAHTADIGPNSQISLIYTFYLAVCGSSAKKSEHCLTLFPKGRILFITVTVYHVTKPWRTGLRRAHQLVLRIVYNLL